MNICPHCLQPIAPTGLHLPPIKQKILDAVSRRPMTAEQLRMVVWDDPSGGPDDPKVIHVHVWQLNRLLAPHGIMVSAGKGAGAVYRIRRIA